MTSWLKKVKIFSKLGFCSLEFVFIVIWKVEKLLKSIRVRTLDIVTFLYTYFLSTFNTINTTVV